MPYPTINALCRHLPVLLVLGCLGCMPDEARKPAALTFTRVDPPASAGSRFPNLAATPGSAVLLSWIEPGDDRGHTLRFARLDGAAWSSPHTIAGGNDWFVNWADFPSLLALDEDVLAAHFLVKNGEAPYAYDVHLTRSDDGGATWTPPVIPHRDGTPTEHGFVSLLPGPDGRVVAVWLDGRNTGGHDGHGGAMTLRSAALSPNGRLDADAELDGRVCDCCQTAATRTANGFLVTYRDRSEEEIRDIASVRWADGRWDEPRTVHDDGWQINGCPVNGPSVAADGLQAAVAWFTAAGEQPRVHVAFSRDEGITFGPPITVDDGAPIGRVDVVLLDGGDALVSWVEQAGDDGALRVRRVAPDGSREPAVTVATVSTARAAGFPRLIRHSSAVVIAWTEAGDPSRVHTAVAALR